MKIYPEDFYRKMNQIKNDFSHNKESAHYEMDNLMCDVLKSLGYENGVEVFEEVTADFRKRHMINKINFNFWRKITDDINSYPPTYKEVSFITIDGEVHRGYCAGNNWWYKHFMSGATEPIKNVVGWRDW